MRQIVPALLVAVTILLLMPGAARGAEPLDYRIAYIDFSKGPWGELCVADAMSEARACLTTRAEGVDLEDLAWSPDGTTIAFQQELFTPAGENTGGQLVLVAADGAKQLRGGLPSPSVVSGDARVHGKPVWSGDGSHVAVPAVDGILIVQATDGSRTTVPLAASPGVHGLAWSPLDGNFVVGSTDPATGKSAVMRVDAATGELHTLIAFEPNAVGNGTFNDISFSRDGQRILFTYAPPPPSAPWSGSQSQHWVMNADGTGARELYDSPRNDGPGMAARLSPDGTRVLYDAFTGDVTNVFVVDVDGSSPRQVTSESAGAAGGAFSADGKFISYGDYATATFSIVPSVPPFGPVRRLFWGVGTEWAPAPGPLPAGAVVPEPTSTPEPTAKIVTPTETAQPITPIASGLTAPNTGGSAGDGSRPVRPVAATMALLGAVVAASGFALRMRRRRAGR